MWSVRLNAQLQPPEGFSETDITPTSFTVHWNASLGADTYRIDVSTTSNFASFVYQNQSAGSGTSYTVTGLNANTTYWYRMRAVKFSPSETSSNSGTADVATSSGVPAAPTPLSPAELTNVSFTARWNSVTNATGYYLDVSTSSSFASFLQGYDGVAVGSITSALISNLSPNATYYYRVRAANSYGVSGSSNTITVLTLLSAPVATGIDEATDNSFKVKWSPVGGASSYRVDVSQYSNFSSMLSGYDNLSVANTETEVVVNSVSSSTTYYYRVRAVNASGSSLNSNEVLIPPKPQATTTLAADEVTTTSFRARWNTGTGAAWYVLEVAADAGFTVPAGGGTPTGTSATVSGLASNTTYYYRVRSANVRGNSDVSETRSIITLPSPPSVTDATNNTGISFQANWTGGTPQNRLDVSTQNNFSTYLPNYENRSVSQSSEVVTGVTAGTTYYYRVRASNGSEYSENSDVKSVLTVSAPPVLGFPSDISPMSFVVNWQPSSTAISYKLDVSASASFESFVDGFENLHIDNTSILVESSSINVITTRYYYRVRSVNSSGTSVNSEVAHVGPFLTIPVLLETTHGTADSFVANWTSVENATNYQLDVSTTATFETLLDGFEGLVTPETHLEISGLNERTQYFIRLRALNSTSVSLYTPPYMAYSLDKNYVSTIDVLVADKVTTDQVASATTSEKMERIEFFDGLGRLTQRVAVRGSPSQNDIVEPFMYDEFGRQTKGFLPYAESTSTGWFRIDALGDPLATGSASEKYATGGHYAFYQNGGALASDAIPYSLAIIEPSPLNRVVEQGAPGAAWQPGTDHTVKYTYLVNSQADSVLNFQIHPTTGDVYLEPGVTSFYAAGELRCKRTTDEDNNVTAEFVDKEGRTICKEVWLSTNMRACTYYVYDSLGNLVVVFQPEAIRKIKSEL